MFEFTVVIFVAIRPINPRLLTIMRNYLSVVFRRDMIRLRDPACRALKNRLLFTAYASRTMNRSLAIAFRVILAVVSVAAFAQRPLSAQVFNDDVEVLGSLGVGIDTSGGQSYGFDTIILKENNLRILFQDTSTSASFPTNDWRITINDSSNGGESYFGVEDVTGGRRPFTIEAGARTNALYVDNSGDIGIGTNNPVADLHVVNGNTPTLRLEQDGSSGFTPQTWDVGGNEANFFIRDATNGSKLPIRLRPNAETSSIDIAAGNKIGFGTGSPSDGDGLAESFIDITTGLSQADARVVVDSKGTNTYSEFLMQQDNENRWGVGKFRARFYVKDYAGGDVERFTIKSNSGRVGLGNTNPTFDLHIGTSPFSGVNAGDTAFTNTSSRSMKENLQPIQVDGILSKIQNVNVYTYDYIDGPKDKLGLMAEDFHQVFKRGTDTTINGQEVQMALWLAVQELEKRTASQQKRIDELEVLLDKFKDAEEE